MTPKDFVANLFRLWERGDSAPFMSALAPDLTWTARGTTPISGTVHGKDTYFDKIYKPLLAVFTGPTRCRVRQIVAEGDNVVVEWHGDTPTASGTSYSQDYCWIIRVTIDGHFIQEVTGYFDTALVTALLTPPPNSAP
jgi:ketosteroid isomerase-like protein